LPDRIARVDHRANDYSKLMLYRAAQSFCSVFHEARTDQIKLFALPDRNLVARISIVQHITEQQEEEFGQVHRFKFYAGDDFFTDVYLNGKRIVFASHALERFSSRVTNQIGMDLINMLDAFFGFPVVLMLCNDTPAFVYHYRNSIIACPVRFDSSDYFLPTCLTVNEINKLEPILPPPAFSLHYDPVYKVPNVRNWNVLLLVVAYQRIPNLSRCLCGCVGRSGGRVRCAAVR
jgi:hypothetical protein